MFKPTTVIYCAYELGVHAFFKSDLIDCFLGTSFLLRNTRIDGNLCNEIRLKNR